MTTWLAQEAVAQKAFPYSWTLSADTWDDATSDAPWAATSDGYKIVAALGWAKLDAENEDASGTSGACVAANGSDGKPMTTGSPFVCTLMDTDGNQASVGTVTTFGSEVWGENFKGSNRGVAIDHTVNLDAMKLAVEAVEAVEEPAADDEVAEDEGSFEDGDLQAEEGEDDDGWAETGDDVEDATDAAVEDATEAAEDAKAEVTAAADEAVAEAEAVVEEVKAFAWAGPAATFQWYQPAKATSYAGLRRYEAGDSVTFYNVQLHDDADTPLPVSAGSVSTLNGAATLIAGVVAFGVSTLAF